MKNKLVLIFLLLCCVCLTYSCRGKTVYLPVVTERTRYDVQQVRDSLVRIDSVFVRERGDSVWLERYRYIYRDRLLADTVLRIDSISVPYPVVETHVQTVYPRWLVLLAVMGGGAVVFGLGKAYLKLKGGRFI